MAQASTLKHCSAQREAMSLECEQIDALHDNIAAQGIRCNRFHAQHGSNCSKVFELNQRDLAFAVPAAVAITFDTSLRAELEGRN